MVFYYHHHNFFSDGEFKKEHKDKLAQTEVPSYEMAVVSPREPTTSDFAMVSAISFTLVIQHVNSEPQL